MVAVVAALAVPLGTTGAAQTGSDVVLEGTRTVTVKPRAGAPSASGVLVGAAPSVTGDARVDTTATPPEAGAFVSARGREGSYRAQLGAAFTTTAPGATPVLGTLEISVRNLRWAGELRWDGTIVDFHVPGPGGRPDGCRGCLVGYASADVVASAVDLDSGEVLASETVASPTRQFSGPDAVTAPVSGRGNVTFPAVSVPSGTRVGVYVTLVVTAGSGLRDEATTGSATADFMGTAPPGDTTSTTTSGPSTTGSTAPPERGQRKSRSSFAASARTQRDRTPFRGVSYDDVVVKLTGTEALEQESECAGPEITPSGPAQTAIVQYYRAIDAGDYATAYGLLDPRVQSGWAAIGPGDDGAANFAAFMGEHVECVVVTGITTRSVPGDPEVSASTGVQWYEIQLDARVLVAVPGGQRRVPAVHEGEGRPEDRARTPTRSHPRHRDLSAPAARQHRATDEHDEHQHDDDHSTHDHDHNHDGAAHDDDHPAAAARCPVP